VLTDPPARNRYAFSCPGCSAIEHRLADDDTVALLSRFVRSSASISPPKLWNHASAKR